MDACEWISCAILARYLRSRRLDAWGASRENKRAWCNAAVELADRISEALEPTDAAGWERAFRTGEQPMCFPALLSAELWELLERLPGDPNERAQRVLLEHALGAQQPPAVARSPEAHPA